MDVVENLVKATLGEIEKVLSTKTVVGEPMVVEGATLVPLVCAGFGFGAGGGEGKGEAKQKGEGAGGGTGGGAWVKPVAVVIIDGQGVRVEPIRGGLATALWEFALAADVGLRVEAASIPVLEAAPELCAHFGIDPLGTIASGALLAAVAPADADRVIRACAAAEIACARIATAVDPSRGVKIVDRGREADLPRFDQDEIVKAF